MKLGHITAVVEIPKGSSKKYELDLKTGKFRVDRVLPGGLKYPIAYGFIPQTLDADGDALDIMILTRKKLKQGDKVRVKPIAMLQVIDNKRGDDKILAVLLDSKLRANSEDKSKIGYFFKGYKRDIIIKSWLGKRQAYKEIRECMKRYKSKFGDKIDGWENLRVPSGMKFRVAKRNQGFLYGFRRKKGENVL